MDFDTGPDPLDPPLVPMNLEPETDLEAEEPGEGPPIHEDADLSGDLLEGDGDE